MQWENKWRPGLPIESEQGYLVIAVNSQTVDYVKLARRLASSLKKIHPTCQVCLLTDFDNDNYDEFDFVRKLPFGDQGGYANDWQAWHASPFRETIKLEADMLVTSAIDHWWHLFRHRDVVISTGARDFYDQSVSTRLYRKVFDQNNLPDVYNAITYWRVSETAQEFWRTVRNIFQFWVHYCTLIKFAPVDPDTDLVYAMAAEIVGQDRVLMPFTSYPKIVHMKRHAVPIRSKHWHDELVWENLDFTFRVNSIAQWGCLHYVDKDWKFND